jgi:peptidoglycan/LPS O-acetylase OafA/YrhL
LAPTAAADAGYPNLKTDAHNQRNQLSARSMELDALRFLAIALVLVRHLPPIPETLPEVVRVPLYFLYEGGWTGVDLFFVLSGFLISGLLFREYQRHQSIRFKQFFIRRGFKIYPAFYLLIVSTGSIAIVNQWNRPWKRIVTEGLFIQSYFPGLWGQTWSLAIEEHFYVLLPLLLIGLVHFRKKCADPFRDLPWIYLLLMTTTLALRISAAARTSFEFANANTFVYTMLYPTHLRIDSLFLGVLAGYLYYYHPANLRKWIGPRAGWLLGLSVLLLLPNFLWPLLNTPYHYTVGFTLTAGAYAVIMLLSVIHGFPVGPLGRRLFEGFAYVGARSYSIYLWHLAILMLLQTALPRWGSTSWSLTSLSYIVGSLLFGLIMARAIETPVLRVRDRLFPSRSRPLTLQPSGSATE